MIVHQGGSFGEEAYHDRGEATIRTVNGDGNALAEDVAVGALEGGDLAQLVDFVVVGGWGQRKVNNLDVEVVGLCDGLERRGAWVVLCCAVRTV